MGLKSLLSSLRLNGGDVTILVALILLVGLAVGHPTTASAAEVRVPYDPTPPMDNDYVAINSEYMGGVLLYNLDDKLHVELPKDMPMAKNLAVRQQADFVIERKPSTAAQMLVDNTDLSYVNLVCPTAGCRPNDFALGVYLMNELHEAQARFPTSALDAAEVLALN